MPSASRPIRPAALAKRCTAVLATGAVLAAGLLGAGPAAAAVQTPRLMVTEIVPNTAGPDDFEFFEVANTTAEDIDLAAEGIGFHYTGVASEPRLETEQPTVVPAGGVVVLWLSYTDGGSVDSFARSEADFIAAFPQADADVRIVRVTGQPGMANGGDRGIRIVDAEGAEISESFYRAGEVGEHEGASFGLRAEGGTDLEFRAKGAPTPGAVDPALLQPGEPDPEPVPAPGAGSNAGDVWPLVVTEIMADNAGVDDFEYVEVVNTSDRDLDLDAEGIGFAYTYADDDVRDRDVRYELPEGTVIPAGEVAVLWVQSARPKTDAQFRAFYDLDERVDVIPVTGTAPSNAGERGIRITGADGVAIGWSYYRAADIGAGRSAEFRVPDALEQRSMPLHRSAVAPTPGEVDPATLVSARIRPADPGVDTAPLQVTEITADTTNVGSADGYEYVEVYNATDRPIDWADYTLRYLYPLADLTNSQTALWPSSPRSTVIDAGGTLVLWVKNGPNDALTDADFNREFGTDLVLGDDLLEVFAGGMANGSPRGIEIVTNTEYSVNRGYYNLGGAKDVAANRGIHYASNPDDRRLQLKQSIGTASPGTVAASQVPSGLMVVPEDVAAPAVEPRTGTTFAPGEPLEIVAAISDDVLVRTATVEVSNDVDAEPVILNLVPGADGLFRTTVPGADTIGKQRYVHRITASDGVNDIDSGDIAVEAAEAVDAVRITPGDGEQVRGGVAFSAAADAYPATLEQRIDGAPVAGEPALETEPVFAFEATATDAYFRNGVKLGDEELTIFDEGVYAEVVTIPTGIPLDAVNPGEPFTVGVWAGTKAAPEIDFDENNDDFQIRNLRLVLPDGRTLRPSEGYDPQVWLRMGDGLLRDGTNPSGLMDVANATFTVPEDAFTARSFAWDTTSADDGPHALTAVDGTASARSVVTVDNTAPEISTPLEERRYQGEFTIDASATDAGSGLAALTAALNGRPIELPHRTSSLSLEAAEHEVVFTATDALGNVGERTVRFSTPVEEPGNELLSPLDGEEIAADEVELRARATDPTGDDLDVDFGRGYRLTPGDGIEVAGGAATDAAGTDRSDAVALTAEQVAALGAIDEEGATTASAGKLPFQTYEVAVPEGATEGSVRLRWDGSANAGAKVRLLVLDERAGAWMELDRHLTTDGEPTTFRLEAMARVADHAADGSLTVLVQHSEGFAGDDLSDRGSVVEPNHPDDVARSEYDATIAWESDTQYYNASDDLYDRQTSIHEYLLRERDDLNLQYLLHTGDIVDQSEDPAQWLRADPTYATLDAADLPYGVLAGNHDVNQATNDYAKFSQYFGEARFAGNPWYGGSHLDNRGHFDLVTVAGVDLLMLYMGWAPGDEQIAWMNEVLAQYPERVAVVALHEYMLTTGGLGPVPQRIYDEVVATNANVRFVVSGHYHDAHTRLDSFDDDGDGAPDRTVTQMLFDYQGLPEGGQGYLRLLHVDTEGERIMVRTYSDYERDYDSDDPTLAEGVQSFDIPFAQAGIAPVEKTLTADAFSAEVFTDETIDRFEGVGSGSELSTVWNAGEGEHGWFVRATDPHGAVAYSEVRTVVLTGEAGPVDPTDPGTDPTDPTGPGEPGMPSSPGVPAAEDALTDALRDLIDAPDAVRAGDALTISVGEQRTGDWVQAWLRSEPTALGGWTRVDIDGRIGAVIPAGTAPGEHRLVVQAADGTVLGWTPITVLDAIATGGGEPSDGTSEADAGTAAGTERSHLSRTGSDEVLATASAAVLLAALGAALLLARRLRRAG